MRELLRHVFGSLGTAGLTDICLVPQVWMGLDNDRSGGRVAAPQL